MRDKGRVPVRNKAYTAEQERAIAIVMVGWPLLMSILEVVFKW